MPDEIGTETIRTETPDDNDGPFQDASDDTNAEAVEESQDSDVAKNEAAAPEDLKVVVSIRGGRATIGVQRPSSDPHIESFDDPDLCGLAQEVLAVTERAKAGWEEAPKHPVYERPAPPARRRNRRGQGSKQASTAEAENPQQQTLRLF